MKRNYLLVYGYERISTIQHRYFETLEDMKQFIKEQKNKAPKDFKAIHKYEIKEI